MLSRRAVVLATPFAAALALDPVRCGAALVPRSTFPASMNHGLISPNDHPSSQLLASSLTRATPAPEAIAPAAAALRALSVDLYHTLSAASSRRDNLVYSPYSIMIALAMARAGARGVTATEMDTVLHAPKPVPRALDAGLNALEQYVRAAYDATGDAKQPQLGVANSLWAQLGLSIEADFLNTLATYYGAGIHTVDFKAATEAARQEINAWISDHTNGKIPELLAKGTITPLTALVLANALYLKASWEFPFNAKATQPSTFTRDDGRVLTVDMMIGRGEEFGYLEGDDWYAVDLPYFGRQLAMAIVVPKARKLSELEKAFDSQWLTALLTGFRTADLRVRLPRWKFRLPADLGEVLTKLGMVTAFTGGANFEGITREASLRISKVVHETFISVDEKGTEAAAATAVIIERTSLPKLVTVDRPFFYVIHDVKHATPFFVGRVGDPTISS